ncbi:MAG: cupin domain-containing protein [Sphaerochaetaceae bacterium]|nr:cupin domain-containing protein [Sphaerochaetaceae bacterium]
MSEPKIPKILNLEKCPWYVAREKVAWKCFHGENMTIQYAKVDPGHSINPHRHDYEQIAMIIEGECDFVIDGIAYPMSAGSIIDIPAMSEHYIIAKGDKSVIDLDIFYPRRDERKESVEVTNS